MDQCGEKSPPHTGHTVFLLISLASFLRRRSSPGACLPSSSSPHLSLLSRHGVNPLQSSGSGPYLNTVSIHLLLLSLIQKQITACVISSANTIPFWFGLFIWFWSFCHLIHESVLSCRLFTYNSFTVLSLFIFLSVCVSYCLVNGSCLFVWSFGNLGPACVLGRCPSHRSIWLPQLNEWRKREKQRRLKTRETQRGRWERKGKYKMY